MLYRPPATPVLEARPSFVSHDATPGTISLQAYYRDSSGQVTSPAFNVAVNSGFFASLTASAQFTGGSSYQAMLSGSRSGGTPPYTFQWDEDGDGTYLDATGPQVAFTFTSQGGTYLIGLDVMDSMGTHAFASQRLTVNKPTVPGEPPDQTIPPDPAPPGFKSANGSDSYTYDPNRVRNGLQQLLLMVLMTRSILLVGRKSMADAITHAVTARNGSDKVPNILLYDWER